MKQIYVTGQAYSDINPLFAGIEQCQKGQSFGPTMREYTLIHYILSGTGHFQKEDMKYRVNPGQIFVILPGEITYYEADLTHPWHYLWIAFDGKLSCKLSELKSPILPVPGQIFDEIKDCIIENRPDSFLLLSCIYKLLSEIFTQKSESHPAEYYAKSVRKYIDIKYMDLISVENIALELHLNRRYLTRLFKQKYGMTIRDYIIQVRIEQAKKYLCQGFSVRETAAMVGYTDTFNFSKAFKKSTGIPPSKQYSSQNKSGL